MKVMTSAIHTGLDIREAEAADKGHILSVTSAPFLFFDPFPVILVGCIPTQYPPLSYVCQNGTQRTSWHLQPRPLKPQSPRG